MLTALRLFFFSSRRRHTRCLSDWSSDVCSSDLRVPGGRGALRTGGVRPPRGGPVRARRGRRRRRRLRGRSEERRVGKECECGGTGEGLKKNTGTVCASVMVLRTKRQRKDRTPPR